MPAKNFLASLVARAAIATTLGCTCYALWRSAAPADCAVPITVLLLSGSFQFGAAENAVAHSRLGRPWYAFGTYVVLALIMSVAGFISLSVMREQATASAQNTVERSAAYADAQAQLAHAARALEIERALRFDANAGPKTITAWRYAHLDMVRDLEAQVHEARARMDRLQENAPRNDLLSIAKAFGPEVLSELVLMVLAPFSGGSADARDSNSKMRSSKVRQGLRLLGGGLASLLTLVMAPFVQAQQPMIIPPDVSAPRAWTPDSAATIDATIVAATSVRGASSARGASRAGGAPAKGARKPRRRVTQKDVAVFIELRERSYSLRAIAAQTGFSHETVRQYLLKALLVA